MNHTIKGILIVVAITSMLVLGASMIPIMQNSFASKNPDFKQAQAAAACNPSTVGGQIAILTVGTCTAMLPGNSTEPQKDIFQRDCLSILHSNFVHEPNGDLSCIFPAYTISDMSYPYRSNIINPIA
jgi:hypothetical protein